MLKITLKKVLVFVAAVALLLAPVTPLSANTLLTNTGGAQSVALSATISESITLTVASTPITFGAGGVASGPILSSVSWILGNDHAELDEYAYFATPSAALTGSAGTLTSGQILSSTNGATAGTCNTTGNEGAGSPNIGTVGGACPAIYTTPLTSANDISASPSLSTTLSISPAAYNALAPGTLAGTINFIAAAF